MHGQAALVVFDQGQALEGVADGQFLRHAHAAVQLHGALAHGAGAARHLHLAGGHGTGALGRRLVHRRQRGSHQGARLQQGHVHVGQPVLGDLEAGDGHAELLALAHVVQRVAQQALHHAHRLGAGGQQAFVGHLLQQRLHVAGVRQGLGRRAVEAQLGGPAAIGQTHIALADAGRAGAHQGQAQRAGGVPRADQPVRGLRRSAHQGLAAAERAVGVQCGGHLGQVVPGAGLERGQHRAHRAVGHAGQQGLRGGGRQALQQAGAGDQAGAVRLGQQ